MKKNFKKLMLSIFLFMVLISSTLYFTLENSKNIEKVKATVSLKGKCTCYDIDDDKATDTTLSGCYDSESSCRDACTENGGTFVEFNTTSQQAKACQLENDAEEGICSEPVYNGSEQMLVTGGKNVDYDNNYAIVNESDNIVTATPKANHAWKDDPGNTEPRKIKCEINTLYIPLPTEEDYCIKPEYSGTSQSVVKPAGRFFYWEGSTKYTPAGNVKIYAATIGNTLFGDSDEGSDVTTLNCPIVARSVTIKAKDQTKEFDGTALEADSECEVVSGSIAPGQTMTCTTSGSQTDVGDGTKTLVSVKITGEGGLDTTSFHSITMQNGTLTVTEAPLSKVDVPTCATKTYTGSEQILFEAHTSGDYTNAELKGTEMGDYTVKLTLGEGREWNTVSGKNEEKTITCKIDGTHVESISISGSNYVYRGSTITLIPSFNPIDASNKGITWTSSDTSKATVSDAGVVTGVALGTVTITATTKDGGKTASKTINVYNRSSGTVHVTGVTLSPKTADVEVGKTVSLVATVAPDNATNKNVTWISSDTSKATVSGGVVTGVAPGTVTITVKTEDGNKTATATITVKEATTPDKPVTGVRLTPDVGTVEVGGTFVLEANIEPDNASNKNVTWRSSNPSVATVSGGVVTGVSAGTATITVETVDGNKTATAQVTVTGSGSVGETLEFERSAYSCEVGKKIYTAIRYSRDIQNPPVSPTVTSSDTSVATITTMTARECSSSTTSKCMTLDTEAIQRCVANGAVDINVEKCVPFYRTYYVTIDCKKAGTANLSASILEDIVANASVTVNAAGSEYSIVFHGNGGTLTYQGESSQSLTIKLPGSGTIGDATANITLSKPGYEFVGWFTETDGGIKYDETATFGEIGVSKLYAHWEAVEGAKFTLTYNANGGTACSPSSIEANINTAWGELCTPVRKGYDFAGWYTAKSGGKKITESSIAVENLIVYAQWKKTADSSPNTGITTPIIALLVVALVSSVAFFVVRKKRAQL